MRPDESTMKKFGSQSGPIRSKRVQKIAANTAHMVEIVVPKEPQPARIQVAPQANERPKDATPWTGGTPGPGSW